MRVPRRAIRIGAAAGATAALFATAAPAQARDVKCQLSVGGTFQPGLGPSGGSGTYQVPTGGLVNRSHCTFQNRIGAWAAPLTTRGTFTATSCGNAILTGDPAAGATLLDYAQTPVFGDLDGPVVSQMTYTIELREWQGIVRVTHVNGRPEGGGDDIDGVLTFAPQHACLSQPVETFTAEGSVVVTW